MGTPAPISWAMTAPKKQAAQVVSFVIFLAACVMSCLLLYYAILNVREDPGDSITGVLAWLLKKQTDIFALVGVILVALPGLAVPACVTAREKLSRFGVVIILLLTITFVIAVAANLLLDAHLSSPESIAIASLADSSAQQLAGFALTYLSVLLGLKISDKVAAGGAA